MANPLGVNLFPPHLFQNLYSNNGGYTNQSSQIIFGYEEGWIVFDQFETRTRLPTFEIVGNPDVAITAFVKYLLSTYSQVKSGSALSHTRGFGPLIVSFKHGLPNIVIDIAKSQKDDTNTQNLLKKVNRILQLKAFL